MAPLVSINLCCYNGEEYLRETLDSIVAQTFTDYELVVINDGSTDSTDSIIHEYMGRGCPIVYHSQENHGLGYSRNEAIRRSSGTYLAFIDQDDLWEPGKLEKQMAEFSKRPELGLVFCDTVLFDETGVLGRAYKTTIPPVEDLFRHMLLSFSLNVETVVVGRACLDALGEWFDTRFNLMEDHDLFARIAHSWPASYVDEPLARTRIHLDSLSWKRDHLWPVERQLMLDKFRAIYREFDSDYAQEVKQLEYRIQREHAFVSWKKGENPQFRKRLTPYLWGHRELLKEMILSFFLTYPQYVELRSRFQRMRSRLK